MSKKWFLKGDLKGYFEQTKVQFLKEPHHTEPKNYILIFDVSKNILLTPLTPLTLCSISELQILIYED